MYVISKLLAVEFPSEAELASTWCFQARQVPVIVAGLLLLRITMFIMSSVKHNVVVYMMYGLCLFCVPE